MQSHLQNALLRSIAINLLFVTDTSTCHYSAEVTASAYGLLKLQNHAKYLHPE